MFTPKYLPALLLAHWLLASLANGGPGGSMEGRRAESRGMVIPHSQTPFLLFPPSPPFSPLPFFLHLPPFAPPSSSSSSSVCVFKIIARYSFRSLLDSSSLWAPSFCRSISTTVLASAKLPSFCILLILPPPRIQLMLEKEAASCYG